MRQGPKLPTGFTHEYQGKFYIYLKDHRPGLGCSSCPAKDSFCFDLTVIGREGCYEHHFEELPDDKDEREHLLGVMRLKGDI